MAMTPPATQSTLPAFRAVTLWVKTLRKRVGAMPAGRLTVDALLRGTAMLGLPLLLAACGGGSSSSPPAAVTAVAGDSQVTLSWAGSSDVEYWIFFAPNPTISPENFVSVPQSQVIRNATNPQVIAPLNNGTTYWFTINGRTKGGPGGSGTPAVAATPRPAGSVWTAGPPLGSAALNGVAFGLPAAFVAGGMGGALYSSADGTTWTAQTSGVTNDLYALAYASSGYVAVGTNGITLRSGDGITWSSSIAGNQSLYGIAPQGSGFIAVGAAGTILTSPEGTTWTPRTSGTTANLRGVAFGNALYVVAGDSGALLTSSDLATWKPVASGTTATLRSLSFGLGRFVAVGDQGVIITSTDGVAWTPVTNPTSETLAAVSVGSQFVAVGRNGRILISADGLTWQPVASGTTGALDALATSGHTYVAVGDAGINVRSF